ncbi:MAG: transposase [bacterium]
MPQHFLPCNRDQLYLLPPSLLDWVKEDSLALFLLDVVEEFDLSAFYQSYREDGMGRAAFQPSMMVALLLYAYCVGERSSRRIEQLCGESLSFRVITANQQPDHSTIARFRREHTARLDSLFERSLQLCAKAGLVKLGVVALDGTKLQGNTSISANRTKDGVEREIRQWIARQAHRMLAEAETKDQEEDALYGPDKRGDELPADLQQRSSRLARLRQCKVQLEEEAARQAAAQQQRLDRRAALEEAGGRKLGGRKPKTVEEAVKQDAQANPTDPDSRLLKIRLGYLQGYNAQVIVNQGQVILAAHLTQERNDWHQLPLMVRKAEENLCAARITRPIGTILADAGYLIPEPGELERAGCHSSPHLLIATKKDWEQRKACQEMPPPRGRIPKDFTPRQRMERKLRTKEGKRLYRSRSQMVEPVFGQIKGARHFDRLLLRGYRYASGEWQLICATHNLLKCWRSGKIVKH